MNPGDSSGYSVEEAADLLGVAPGRVWELLARGVLAGEPLADGGYRVALQPQAPRNGAATQPSEHGVGGGAAAPSGGGPAPGGGAPAPLEVTVFRELLTEFRNLTERYGQALLALGEARGEVAQLRQRVELLEARVDLRLPGGAAPGPGVAGSEAAAWSEQAPAGGAEEAAATATGDRSSAGSPDAAGGRSTGGAQRRRKPSPRKARPGGSGIAAALERARDPTSPLPGAEEAAAALAALRGEVPAAESGDLAMPVSADRVPVEEEPASPPGPPAEPEAPAAAQPEPDWIADEDLYSFASLEPAPQPRRAAAVHSTPGSLGEAPVRPLEEASPDAPEQLGPGAPGAARAVDRSMDETPGGSSAEARATTVGIEVAESAETGRAWRRAAVQPLQPAPEVPILELPGRRNLDAALAALEEIAVSPRDLAATLTPNGRPIAEPAVHGMTPTAPSGVGGSARASGGTPSELSHATPSDGTPGAVEAGAVEAGAVEPGGAASPAEDWLRGQRGAAARAYRRIRRLFSR